MHYVGLQSSIWANRTKTLLLVTLFPVMLFAVIRVVFFVMFWNESSDTNIAINDATYAMSGVLGIVGPIILIRGLISFFFYRQIIFSFSGAKPVTRKEYPEIYNIVENLCISKGLPTPKIGIIDDESMNAFAIGRDPKHAWIVFSQGIINKLSKREIEAVAGHELTHIINRDSLLMIVVVVFVGIIGTLGEIILRIGLRSGGGDKKDGQLRMLMIVVGICLLVLGYIFFPLIQLAISRKREFLADAGSVELTKDKQSMIDALKAISTDSVIESIKKQTVASMCIENPFDQHEHKKGSRGQWFQNIWSTHPSITDRISALEKY